MKEIRNEEIEHLAESIVSEGSMGIPIDPYYIAQKYGIEVIEGTGYGSYFNGIIVHTDGKFYIVLNMDVLTDPYYNKSKYTCAHELGHFFIKEHKELLEKGISMPYTSIRSSNIEVKKREDQAQLFAAALLMPRSIFIEQALKLAPGFGAIIELSRYFKTSFLSTAIRYSCLDIVPTIQILWYEEGIKGRNISNGFAKVLGKDPLMKVDPNRYQMDEEEITFEMTEYNSIKFKRSITSLSSWVFNLDEIGIEDMLVCEETFHCASYNLTLLRMTQ